MIRVRKSVVVPPPLLVPGCSKHDRQDVQDALVLDSDKKCYLCEQFTNKTFQIEHNKGQTAHPLLMLNFPLLSRINSIDMLC